MTGDIYWLTNSVHFANQRTFQETKNTIDREYTKSTEEFMSQLSSSVLPDVLSMRPNHFGSFKAIAVLISRKISKFRTIREKIIQVFHVTGS